jgi:hypothetical protein
MYVRVMRIWCMLLCGVLLGWWKLLVCCYVFCWTLELDVDACTLFWTKNDAIVCLFIELSRILILRCCPELGDENYFYAFWGVVQNFNFCANIELLSSNWDAVQFQCWVHFPETELLMSRNLVLSRNIVAIQNQKNVCAKIILSGSLLSRSEPIAGTYVQVSVQSAERITECVSV